ncbi:MAG TPA: helix-turn-helix domain-containing protein [Gemmata sp.]|jgi:excisionase family DNA binding protein|nr:helix-turn-helix domain-containing protein [Gemmata sp.]
MYTVSDISTRYGVTAHTVIAWIHSGDLSAVNVGRGSSGGKPRWRISEEALAAFEQRRASAPATPVPKFRAARRRRDDDVIAFYD